MTMIAKQCPHCRSEDIQVWDANEATQRCYDYQDHITVTVFICMDCGQKCEQKLIISTLRAVPHRYPPS